MQRECCGKCSFDQLRKVDAAALMTVRVWWILVPHDVDVGCAPRGMLAGNMVAWLDGGCDSRELMRLWSARTATDDIADAGSMCLKK